MSQYYQYYINLTLLVLLHIYSSEACLCSILIAAGKFTCPAPPTCCESGQYAYDECGCCQKCAKAELQTCGGASDISGRCGSGLQCLKTCMSCKTVGREGKPCIFPFKYGGETYDKCTTRDSDGGQPWCATQIDREGYVVDNTWADCLDGCPGTRLPCDDAYFSIQEGLCIDISVPGAIPNWLGAPTVKLLDPTSQLFPAPVCRTKGAARRLYDNTCRCARGLDAVDYAPNGQPRGNCTGLEDDRTDNLDKVWCFLENIRDPRDPKSGCYPDVIWSERDARYWSSLACYKSPDIEGGVKKQSGLPRPTKYVLNIEKQRTVGLEQDNSEEHDKYAEVTENHTEQSDVVVTEAVEIKKKIPLPNLSNEELDDFTIILNDIFYTSRT